MNFTNGRGPFRLVHLFCGLFIACGGSASLTPADSSPVPPEGQTVSVTVAPGVAVLAPQGTKQLTATVSGTSVTAVTWSVKESTGGTVTAGGLYSAPATKGTYHVLATSVADSTKSASATIDIAIPGDPGAWQNMTPSGVSLVGDGNYGVQDVLVDPARPSDIYAFICYQGVWKSTDYGLTWTKISTGTNGSTLDKGRPWTAAIWPDPKRDPTTPPTLWTVNGYGPQLGVYKSTDGGVNWTYTKPGNGLNSDVYSLDVDPYDGNHLLAGFHEAAGLAESTDGGKTWSSIPIPTGAGNSIYAFFIDTGTAATTRTTWMTMPQWNGGQWGLWRTADGGQTWSQRDTLEHAHGCTQIFNAGGGTIYAAGLSGSQGHGVYRSTDYGVTWTRVNDGSMQNGVYGTSTYIYASYGWASGGTVDQNLERSLTSDGAKWPNYMTAPTGFTNGAKRAAVTFDGTHYVIISGNWMAGIWRYVEP